MQGDGSADDLSAIRGERMVTTTITNQMKEIIREDERAIKMGYADKDGMITQRAKISLCAEEKI